MVSVSVDLIKGRLIYEFYAHTQIKSLTYLKAVKEVNIESVVSIVNTKGCNVNEKDKYGEIALPLGMIFTSLKKKFILILAFKFYFKKISNSYKCTTSVPNGSSW